MHLPEVLVVLKDDACVSLYYLEIICHVCYSLLKYTFGSLECHFELYGNCFAGGKLTWELISCFLVI